MTNAWDDFDDQFSGPLPARRKRIEREDGSVLSYSIPKGVTDEQAASEVEGAERRIARGYSYKMNFHDAGPRWLESLLTARDKAGFWFKCRWLDAYWLVMDRVRR